MFKVSLTLLLILLINRCASAEYAKPQAKWTGDDYLSAEYLSELDIDDLIKSLETRINAKNPHDKEFYKVVNGGKDEPKTCEKASIFQNPKVNYRVHPNLNDRKLLKDGFGEDQQAKANLPVAQAPLEARARLDKRKISDAHDHEFDEIKRAILDLSPDDFKDLSTDPVYRNQLSDFEKDEQYYRALVRLQKLYQQYGKQFGEDGPEAKEGAGDERSSRHCHLLGHKLQEHKLRYLEKSRLLADRIAESAMRMARKKDALIELVQRPCGCGYLGSSAAEASLASAASSASASASASADADVKRDAEVLASSAALAASSVDTSDHTDGVGIDVGTHTSVDTSARASTYTDGATDYGYDQGYGLGHAHAHALADSYVSANGYGYPYAGKLGLDGYLSSAVDYERRMIMDLAIEEAAAMIRRLALETRSEVAYRDDPNFDKRVLGLAIDLVNKVTEGVTGDVGGKFEVLKEYRYKDADEYLRESGRNHEEIAPELLSNAGFDYVNYGMARQMLDDDPRLYDLDLYGDYVGHPSPYSRGVYDPIVGNTCPLCKRNENIFQGRSKRKETEDKGKIHHLEKMEDKVNIK